jgi:hypothetical protein
VGTGIGTFRGEPVVVVLAARADRQIAVVLDPDTCEIRSEVAL